MDLGNDWFKKWLIEQRTDLINVWLKKLLIKEMMDWRNDGLKKWWIEKMIFCFFYFNIYKIEFSGADWNCEEKLWPSPW